MSDAAVALPFVAPEPATDPVESRRQRGLAIASVTRITRAKGNEERWIVPSQTGRRNYTVDMTKDAPSCDCSDFAERGGRCKHIYAVEFFKAPETAPAPLVRPTTEAGRISIPVRTCAPRPTYKQNWPAYDKAQIFEKEKLQSLLAELCQGVTEPPRPHDGVKGGRPPIPMADRVFACAFKVYTTFSARRASTDVREAKDKEHLSRAPHYSRVNRFMEDPAMTPILMSLIAEKTPGRSIESDFCVDSSGFATSRFVRWYDHKYGVVKQEYDWVKVSVCTGKTTNVVTAVEIDERYAADCPKFAPLIGATAKNFKIREVSADAAYLSYENMELAWIPTEGIPANKTAEREPGSQANPRLFPTGLVIVVQE